MANFNIGRWLKSVFNRSLHRQGYDIRRLTQLTPFDDLLYRQLKRNPDFRFIQIGANDGVSFDPIFEFSTRNGVTGIVVEPLADSYAQLQMNYSAYPRIRPLNVAIHRDLRYIDLYRIDPNFSGELPGWAIGIASLNPDHFQLGGGIPDEAICVERVPAITLQALFDDAGYSDLDLLQIDTEGYDLEIIRMIDFDQIKPAIIHFEHGLEQGIMDEQQFEECFRLLRGAGYYLMMEKFDAIAVQPELLPG